MVPKLPARLWVLQAGVLINFLGNGMVAPFLVIDLHFGVMLPTTVALAPTELRGRYLGAMGLSWQAGFLVGPSIGAAVLGAAPLAMPVLCAAGCLVAAIGARAVDRRLAPELRGGPIALAAS